MSFDLELIFHNGTSSRVESWYSESFQLTILNFLQVDFESIWLSFTLMPKYLKLCIYFLTQLLLFLLLLVQLFVQLEEDATEN